MECGSLPQFNCPPIDDLPPTITLAFTRPTAALSIVTIRRSNAVQTGRWASLWANPDRLRSPRIDVHPDRSVSPDGTGIASEGGQLGIGRGGIQRRQRSTQERRDRTIAETGKLGSETVHPVA